MVWVRLVWFGLVWVGLVWFGLVCLVGCWLVGCWLLVAAVFFNIGDVILYYYTQFELGTLLKLPNFPQVWVGFQLGLRFRLVSNSLKLKKQKITDLGVWPPRLVEQ